MEQINKVTAYIAACPVDRQPLLSQVRATIKDALPAAEECLKYGMPTYYQQENLVHFSNAKNHLGFYPTPSAIQAFSEQLVPYKTSKGAVQFPFSKPIPYELIKEMTLWRLTEVTATID